MVPIFLFSFPLLLMSMSNVDESGFFVLRNVHVCLSFVFSPFVCRLSFVVCRCRIVSSCPSQTCKQIAKAKFNKDVWCQASTSNSG